jgi:hypothetical protein
MQTRQSLPTEDCFPNEDKLEVQDAKHRDGSTLDRKGETIKVLAMARYRISAGRLSPGRQPMLIPPFESTTPRTWTFRIS